MAKEDNNLQVSFILSKDGSRSAQDTANNGSIVFDPTRQKIYAWGVEYGGRCKFKDIEAETLFWTDIDGDEETDENGVQQASDVQTLGAINSDADLNNITKTGFYLYTKNGNTYQLIVQDYPDRWCVQYQFTANNINRRYYDYKWQAWTNWRTIGQDGYNPNESYIATASMIKNGLGDANKYGLRVGDALNGRHVGFSEYDMCMVHDKLLAERKEAQQPYKSYDFKDSTLFDNHPEISSKYKSYDSGNQCWWWKGDLTIENLYSGFFFVKMNIRYVYSNTTISCTDRTYKLSSGDVIIPYSVAEDFINLNSNNYVWINSIEITPASTLGFSVTDDVFTVQKGNSLGLINAFTYAYDNCTIYIPEGMYNVGSLDDTDYKGALQLKASNVIVKGDGRDKTVITGHYINEFSMIKCLLKNEGSYNIFQDFTIISTYLQSIEGQAPALQDSGIDSVWLRCGIVGAQDTLYTSKNSHLFKDCYIEGTVDFIFGGDTSTSTLESGFDTFSKANVFLNTTLACKGRASNDVICAPRGLFYFKDCTIDNNSNYDYSQDNMVFLARPWGNNSSAIFDSTHYNISSQGYTTMATGVNFGIYGDVNGTDVYSDPVEDHHTISPDNELYIALQSYEQFFDAPERILTLKS